MMVALLRLSYLAAAVAYTTSQPLARDGLHPSSESDRRWFKGSDGGT